MRLRIKLLVISIVSSFMGALGLPVATMAAPSYTTFGETSTVAGNGSGAAIQTVSDAEPGFGGIDFTLPSGVLTFADLTTLSTDYNVTDDNCGGGSPRFQINVDTGGGVIKNIFAYIGPEPDYNTCTANTWVSSGDLLDDARAIDTSQLAGGTFYDTYAHASATYGSLPVVGIQLVTDAGWSQTNGEQTVLFDNTIINTTTVTFEPEPTKEDCKKDGWKDFTTSPGPFKNQGQCVSYFARNQERGSSLPQF